MPEEKLFCEIEAFPKQIMVSVAISKAGKDFNTKVNAIYCNVLLKKIILGVNKLANHNIFMQDRARARTAKLTLEILKDKKKLRLMELHHWPTHFPDLNPVDFEI